MYIEANPPSHLVRPLADVVREAYDDAVDADWDGKPNAAALWHTHATLKARLDAGELFYALF